MQNIYQSISAIIDDIGAVGKDRVNNGQGWKFRGIDDVMNAIHPLFAKHKVFVVPQVLEQTREERTSKNGGCTLYSICRIKYTFYAEDGSFVEATTVGEGMDYGDKATNKAMAIAFKYALFQTFCIPTEDMTDPDEDCYEVKSKATGEVDADMGKKLYAVASKAGVKQDKVKEHIAKKFGVNSVKALTKEQYETMLKGYEGMCKK